MKLLSEHNDIISNIFDEEDAIRDHIKNELGKGLPPNIEHDLSFPNDGVIVGNFTLDDVANSIYNTMVKFSNRGGVPDDYILDGSFGIDVRVDEKRLELVEKFNIFKTFIKNTLRGDILNKRFEALDNLRKSSDVKNGMISKGLDKICHDFDDMHKGLNGTCNDCEEWNKTLKSIS